MSEHCCSWFDADIDLDSKEVFIDETLGYLADSDFRFVYMQERLLLLLKRQSKEHYNKAC